MSGCQQTGWQLVTILVREGAALYEAVEAIGMDLCPKLGVSIPVGKDSMSMKMKWKSNGEDKEVTAPVSLVVTSVRKRPVRPGLRSRAAGLGFFGGRPGRTVGHSPAFRVYLTGPGRTADICRLSSDNV